MSDASELEGSKPWYASKGVLGPIVAGASIAAGYFFGVKVDPVTQAYIVDQAAAIISGLFTIGGLVLGVWGRIKAIKKIG